MLPPWLSRSFFCSALLLLYILTCSDTFYIQKLPQKRGFPLQATPKLNLNVALAKAQHAFLRVAAAVFSVPSDVFTTPPMLEPPTQSSMEQEHREKVSELLAEGWNESGVSTSIPVSNEDAPQKSDHDASTYGEVTELGARQLFYYMNMKTFAEETISFFDLGSGNGKLVVQAFLEVPRLRRSVGVELNPTRHDTAIGAWNSIQSKARIIRSSSEEQALSCNEASVQLIQGDLYQVDVTEATHVYIASLCFTSEMMERLADKLTKEASELQCVATLKPFPKHFEWRFGTPTVEYVEMSWTEPRGEGCVVYFYTPP